MDWFTNRQLSRAERRQLKLNRAKSEIAAEVAQHGVAVRTLGWYGLGFWQQAIAESCRENGFVSRTSCLAHPRGGVVICRITRA